MIRIFLAAFALAAPLLASSQGIAWERFANNHRIPSTVYGAPFTPFVAVDASGNAFVATESETPTGSCFVAMKYSAAGNPEWEKSLCTDHLGSSALSVAVDGRGDAIVTGTIVTGYNSESNHSETDFRTVKLSGATGDILWERRFSGIGPPGRSYDIARQVVVDGAGNAYVAGITYDGQYYMLEVIKYNGVTGTTLWDNHAQVTGNYIVAGAGLDPQGNFIVGSQINLGQGGDVNASAGPEIIKFSGQTGVMMWRWRSTSDMRMTALAVDPSGNPVAVYAKGFGTSRDIYVEKHAGSSGAVAWGSTWTGVGDDYPTAIAIDSAGNIAVSASASGLYTVLKYLPNGDRQWQSTFGTGTTAWANSVAFDANGDVVATGAAYEGSRYHQRTTRHAAATGAVVWSSNLGAGLEHEDDSYIVVPAAGGLYVAGYFSDIGDAIPNFSEGLRVMKIGAAAQAVTTLNVHGLWWNEQQSGWGVNLVQQGEQLFATWYAYDTDGKGMWLVMSNGKPSGTNAWTGDVHRTTGPPFYTFSAGNASQVSYGQVGSATFSFSDSGHGTVNTSINGVSRSIAITRFQFGPMPSCSLGGSAGSAPNYTDIWWRPSESGWGVSLSHQGDIVFALWYTYASDARGLWLVASKLDRVADRIYSGPLYTTTGTPFNSSSAWQLPQYQPSGSLTLTFTDANNAIMDYTVSGITQSKPITRYVFATPVTVCR